MKIALASDHGGYDYKEIIKQILIDEGHVVEDFGTYSKESCDYPDFIKPAARSVASGESDRGIIFCSTGIGVSISANKQKGVRCALVSDLLSARLTRVHNDTNVLAIGQFVVGEAMMKEIVNVWLNTEFSLDTRHIQRIAKIESE